MVRVDATTGAYLQATCSGNLDTNAHDFMTANEIKDHLVKGPVKLGIRTIFVTRPELPAGDLPLVWRPCLESFSPFVPFYVVRLRFARLPLTLYVRASDGAVYTRLTDNVGGA
jgi:hypothetical protein